MYVMMTADSEKSKTLTAFDARTRKMENRVKTILTMERSTPGNFVQWITNGTKATRQGTL
jgi:hypothetical protein